MKKNIFKLSVLALVGLTTIVGCGDDDDTGKGSYTYNAYLSVNPTTWNVHKWETSDQSYIMGFTEMGLYDVVLNEEKNGYDFVTEMAASMPVDVSSQLSDEEQSTYYPNVINVSDGMAWEIELNQNATFSDGKKINAQTYVDSMELQLNPKYVNRRADSYYGSSLVVVNAERYFKQQRATIEPAYNYIKNGDTSAGTYTASDSNFAYDNKWYLNLGADTPYGNSVFSGDSTSTYTFYQVLNNRSGTLADNVELAAQRITDSAAVWAFKKFKSVGAEGMNNPDEWSDIESIGEIKEDQLNENILVYDYDTEDIYVRKTKDISMVINIDNPGVASADNDPTTFEKYSSDLLFKDISTVVAALSSSAVAQAKWNFYLPLFSTYYNDDEVSFSSVGIKKVSDYKIRLYLSKTITALDLKFSLTSNWIVDVEMYKSLTKSISTSSDGATYTTSYGSGSADNYNSYGPYKLVTFKDGSYIDIQKNDKWYGWTDGKHTNQYQMTGIYTRIIQNHETVKQEFISGKLDDFTLEAADMAEYGASKRAKTTPESYTSKLSFNTSFSKLKSRQESAGSGINKTILASRDFRQGLSLYINRNTLASNSAGSTASTNLLNSLYLTDVEKGEAYRSTTQGQGVYSQVYGATGFNETETLIEKDSNGNFLNSIGLNETLGVSKVSKAIREEIEANNMQTTDKVQIEYLVYDQDSNTTIGITNYLNETFGRLATAVKENLKNPTTVGDDPINMGDNFTIEVVLKQDTNYYETAKVGNYDMIMSTWGGAAINPWGLMQVYLQASFESCCEYYYSNWQKDVTIKIDMNGNGQLDSDEEKSMDSWYSYLNDSIPEISTASYGGEETDEYKAAYAERHTLRLNVLAGIEAGVVSQYRTIPLYARGNITLNSLKVEDGTTSYINLIGYGGIRFMTFNYDDATWNKMVSNGEITAAVYKA